MNQHAGLVATAHHEAGHAVVASYWYGWPVEGVTIEGRMDGAGMTWLPESGGAPIEDQVVYLFAGSVAETKRTGTFDEVGFADDLFQINRLADCAELPPDQRRAFIEGSRALAVKVLEQPEVWERVSAVARHLLEDGTLTGERLGELVRHDPRRTV